MHSVTQRLEAADLEVKTSQLKVERQRYVVGAETTPLGSCFLTQSKIENPKSKSKNPDMSTMSSPSVDKRTDATSPARYTPFYALANFMSIKPSLVSYYTFEEGCMTYSSLSHDATAVGGASVSIELIFGLRKFL